MFTLFFLLLLSPSTSPSPRVEDPKAIKKQIKVAEFAWYWGASLREAAKRLDEQAQHEVQTNPPPKK